MRNSRLGLIEGYADGNLTDEEMAFVKQFPNLVKNGELLIAQRKVPKIEKKVEPIRQRSIK